MKEQPCVIVESPYAGDVEDHKRYLEQCLRHSLSLDEAPFASHGFYTHFLDDDDIEQRALGMACGRAWATIADKVVFYIDLGMSRGMDRMMQHCIENHILYEVRHLPLEAWNKFNQKEKVNADADEKNL